MNILLPCHLPELIFGARQRALSCYVFPAEIIALQVKRTPLVFIKAEKKDLLPTEQAMGLQPGLCSNNALAGTIVLRAELLDLEPAWTWKQKAVWSREKEETAAVYLNTVPFVAVKAFHCSIVFSTVSSNFGTTRGGCFIYCF